MRSKLFFLGILLLILSLTTLISRSQQPPQNTQPIQVIDFTPESKKSDRIIYVIRDKYYMSDSFETLVAKLNINPQNDIESADIFMTSNPGSRDRIADVLNRLPTKYNKDEIKGLMKIHLYAQ